MTNERLAAILSLCSETARVGDKALSLQHVLAMVAAGEIEIQSTLNMKFEDVLSQRMGHVKSNLRELRDILNTMEL